MRPLAATLMLTSLATVGCVDGLEDPPTHRTTMTTVALSEVTDAQWEALSSRRIFFGHQSVGRNILAGLQQVLEANPEVRLRVVGAEDPASVAGPALIEANIGRNTRPETKADAFAMALDGGFGGEPGAVAMYKYCYVDVQPDTDPDQLLGDYVQRIDAIRARYPELAVVHFTLPLQTAQNGWKEQVKTRLGMSTQIALNIKRNRYNDLLRERYGDTEPVFDLALMESTRADGSQAYVEYRGRKIFMLAPEWTDDGGHLTDEAQVRVAEQLLAFLAQLPRKSLSDDKAPDAAG